MEYLREKQYYIDRYDLLTIKQCLEILDVMTKVYVNMGNLEEAKVFSKGDMAKGSSWYTNQMLYVKKAERYGQKEEIIQNWITEDQIKHDAYNKTPEPQMACPTCRTRMQSSLKHLETLDNPLRMMFLFNCRSCKKKRWIYEDGTERESTPILCPKCKAKAHMEIIKQSEDKVAWKTTCSSCGYNEITVDDLKKSREERHQEEVNDALLLKNYREEFCSEEKGKEAFEYIEALKVAEMVFDEEVKKFDNKAYEKASQLKKLTIVELEKLLNGLLLKSHFVKLSFESPDIRQYIIISFSVQDADSTRKKDVSIAQLKKLLQNGLEETNWRLVGNDLSYRLGYVSGRLKGYEHEDDLIHLSGGQTREKILEVDYEANMKYQGHNVVQLARLMGEFKGVENVRKRRLQKEPDGFFLESDGSYMCGICREATPGDKTWWNLDGVRCADCQRNVKEGVIPSEIHKNDEIWIEDFQLRSEFNIHPSTVKKLERQGVLHGRDLKRENGSVYNTIYLIEENKEFLRNYPRNPRRKTTITDLLGNKVEL